MKIYTYSKCGTCQKAIRFLKNKDMSFTEIPIRDKPPTEAELKKMLHYVGGDIKALFNRSGVDYRAMNLKDKLPTMTTAEAIALLASNGNLIKRPFVLTGDNGWVGFDESAWKKMVRG